METVEARRRLFSEQVLRLAVFSLDYLHRHRGDLEALDRQRDNLLHTTVACGAYAGDWPRAARIALVLEDYMLRRGLWRRWATSLEWIAEALTDRGDPALRGRVLHCLGNAYCGSGQWEQALQAHRRALEALHQSREPHGIADVWFDLGRVHWFRGEWREALRCYRQVAAWAHRLPDGTVRLAQVWNAIGLIHWRQGAWRQAVRCFRRALCLCPDTPEHARRRGRFFSHLALPLTDLGSWDEAERCYHEALRLSETAGDTTGLAYTWGDLSDLPSPAPLGGGVGMPGAGCPPLGAGGRYRRPRRLRRAPRPSLRRSGGDRPSPRLARAGAGPLGGAGEPPQGPGPVAHPGRG